MKKKRMIWAINPFEEERKLLQNAVVLLKPLSAKAQLQVEPVYVVSPAELRATLEFSVPEKERLHAVSNKTLASALQSLHVPWLLKPKVLMTHGLTLEATTTALSTCAEASGAELILAGTHARRGMARVFLGSFAETLAMLSRVPVLLVNLRLEPITNFRSVLFATDFSPESRLAFRRFYETFAPMKSKIILYHALPKPPKWVIQSGKTLVGGKGSRSDRERFQEELSLATKLAIPFLEAAKAAEGTVELVVGEAEGKIYEGILQNALKRHVSVIGMASRSGKLSATLLGSASRGVLRRSEVPVWIFHA